MNFSKPAPFFLLSLFEAFFPFFLNDIFFLNLDLDLDLDLDLEVDVDMDLIWIKIWIYRKGKIGQVGYLSVFMFVSK